jgi:SAM-dependent methyltransferase
MSEKISPGIDSFYRCPACGSETGYVFYTIKHVPVSSVVLLHSSQEARNVPTGTIDLTYCQTCGFIFNRSFTPQLVHYTTEYESTQIFSPTFSTFSHKLARQLIDQYDLHDKTVLEIGCGQGEFLSLLCKEGQNRGIGFDPAYSPERSAGFNHEQVTIIPDYYSGRYENYVSDFLCCRMTLEHIKDVSGFLSTIRNSIGNRYDTVVFFQIPDVSRILKEAAFWDIYYEHCSYFTKYSLVHLIERQGFEIIDVWNDFGNQYLMITACPANLRDSREYVRKNGDEVPELIKQFNTDVMTGIVRWKGVIQEELKQGRRIVLWGSGSKAVAFLTSLDLVDEIAYTIDVNPNKHGTFMPGTCQEVVSPEFLHVYKPGLIILMNPIYFNEVKGDLIKMGLSPKIFWLGCG